MIYEVEITSQAEDDLRGIYAYIAFALLAPDNASAQLERLEEQIYKLNEMPYRHSAYKREPWKSLGLRFIPVDNYIVFFIPRDEKALVSVIRVMYMGRDAEKQLNESTSVKQLSGILRQANGQAISCHKWHPRSKNA